MSYAHTQRGWLHWLILLIAVLELVLAYLLREYRIVAYGLAGFSGLLLAVALAVAWLRLRDDGDGLLVRFGPLPLISKRFPYAEISRVQVDRTRIIDGWIVHYIPGRGWTYNIWGYDCVKFRFRDRDFQIGSDDAENLAQFLRTKCPDGDTAEA